VHITHYVNHTSHRDIPAQDLVRPSGDVDKVVCIDRAARASSIDGLKLPKSVQNANLVGSVQQECVTGGAVSHM
jgi:hypothetical protein